MKVYKEKDKLVIESKKNWELLLSHNDYLFEVLADNRTMKHWRCSSSVFRGGIVDKDKLLNLHTNKIYARFQQTYYALKFIWTKVW